MGACGGGGTTAPLDRPRVGPPTQQGNPTPLGTPAPTSKHAEGFLTRRAESRSDPLSGCAGLTSARAARSAFPLNAGAFFGRRRVMATLLLVRGPGLGKSFALEGGSITIGRQPGVTILLDQPDVSRRHAQ